MHRLHDSLRPAIVSLLDRDPAFIDFVIEHIGNMMPADCQPALANAVGWIYASGQARALILHLETAEMLVEHKHRLHNYADRLRINTGIEHIRIYTPPIFVGEMFYDQNARRWHLDTTPIHA
jgi:hypothetical protein